MTMTQSVIDERDVLVTGAPDTAGLTGAACLFHGFSDRSRLTLIQHLLLGEHRVVDLTRHLGLAQSTVSKHLACLVDCGIAQVRAEGRASIYSVRHPGAVRELLTAAESLLALTGDAVTLCPTYGAARTAGTARTAGSAGTAGTAGTARTAGTR